MQKFNEKQYVQTVPKILEELVQLNNSEGWKQILDGKVEGYEKMSKGNSIIIKGVTITNMPYQSVVSFLCDDKTLKRTDQMCIQHDILYRNQQANFAVAYIQIKTPFPLDNRDAVDIVCHKRNGDLFYIGIQSCDYPVEVPKGVVRAKNNISGYIIQRVGNNQTKVTYISDMDPMGNIPDLIKNSVASKRIGHIGQYEKIMKNYGY